MTRLEQRHAQAETTRPRAAGPAAFSDSGGAPLLRTVAGRLTPDRSGARPDAEPPTTTPTRLLVGFTAGFSSVLIFSSGAIAILHAAGIVPFAPWNTSPAPPFGTPQILSDAFWGGLWGVIYALIEPRLTARLGWWPGGSVFGVALPLLVAWFVVSPLKGMPIAAGFVPSMLLLGVVLATVFGLGTAIIFRFGLHLSGRKAPLSPTTLADRSRG